MKSQKSWDNFYMSLAKKVSELSYDPKTKVGCVIVENDNILSFSYNGTASGTCNVMRDINGDTLNTVVHAEVGAIAKCARQGKAILGATLYCTRAPCLQCALLMNAAGITRVVYGTEHSSRDGVNFLREMGILVLKEDYSGELYPNPISKSSGGRVLDHLVADRTWAID